MYKLIHETNVFICLIFILFLSSKLQAGNHKDSKEPLPAGKTVIADVAGREITLQDFIERAEYTIRPPYCKGSSNVEKNIVLSTLVAEKILALEAGKDNALLKDKKFQDFIFGRKEQKMRSLLSFYEGDMKVSLDTNEIKKAFSLAGRTYKIEYFNVPGKALTGSLTERFAGKDSAFEHMFQSFSSLDSVPHKEVSWSSKELKEIHQALFSDKLKKNQVLGPISLDDTTNLFIKVKGWTDRLAVTESDFNERYTGVVEELTRLKADSIYDSFVLKVMDGKRVDFNLEVLNKLIKVLAPYYLDLNKETENEFMSMAFKNEVQLPALDALGTDYDNIKYLPLLTIDGKVWSVESLKNEMDKHPLVFRKKNNTEKFGHQLRLAIVDLIRDKYLTDAAYARNLDKNEVVTHYEDSWRDASLALFEKDKFLKKNAAGENDVMEILEHTLDPYVKSLLKKYSDRIRVNVEEYDKIKLTRIDMFSLQADVPYRIYVPSFPVLTTLSRLNYGKKMDIKNNITETKTK